MHRESKMLQGSKFVYKVTTHKLTTCIVAGPLLICKPSLSILTPFPIYNPCLYGATTHFYHIYTHVLLYFSSLITQWGFPKYLKQPADEIVEFN